MRLTAVLAFAALTATALCGSTSASEAARLHVRIVEHKSTHGAAKAHAAVVHAPVRHAVKAKHKKDNKLVKLAQLDGDSTPLAAIDKVLNGSGDDDDDNAGSAATADGHDGDKGSSATADPDDDVDASSDDGDNDGDSDDLGDSTPSPPVNMTESALWTSNAGGSISGSGGDDAGNTDAGLPIAGSDNDGDGDVDDDNDDDSGDAAGAIDTAGSATGGTIGSADTNAGGVIGTAEIDASDATGTAGVMSKKQPTAVKHATPHVKKTVAKKPVVVKKEAHVAKKVAHSTKHTKTESKKAHA